MRADQIKAAWLGHPDCRHCSIRSLALFAELTEDDFHGIHLPIDELAFPAGATIYRQGERGLAVFMVRSGCTKLITYLPNGTQRILRIPRAGDALGLEALLDAPYDHTAIALKPTLACKIPADTLNRLAETTPHMQQPLMQHWHQSVMQADAFLSALTVGDMRARMARLILHLMDDEEEGICRFVHRDEAAAILGITTETASRVVSDLKRKGVLQHLGANRFRCEMIQLRELAEN